MQQALHRFKQELRSLDLKVTTILKNAELDSEQRSAIKVIISLPMSSLSGIFWVICVFREAAMVLSELREEVMREVMEMERLLAGRMRRMALWVPSDDEAPLDLGGMHLIHQVGTLISVVINNP